MNNSADYNLFIEMLRENMNWTSFADHFQSCEFFLENQFLQFLAKELGNKLTAMPEYFEAKLTKTFFGETCVVGKIIVCNEANRIRGKVKYHNGEFTGEISLRPFLTPEEELQQKIDTLKLCHWQHRKWENCPALVSRHGSQTIQEYLGQVYDADKWEIVADYWDHAHCELCWAKIAVDGDFEDGYADGKRWICPECYEKYFYVNN